MNISYAIFSESGGIPFVHSADGATLIHSNPDVNDVKLLNNLAAVSKGNYAQVYLEILGFLAPINPDFLVTGVLLYDLGVLRRYVTQFDPANVLEGGVGEHKDWIKGARDGSRGLAYHALHLKSNYRDSHALYRDAESYFMQGGEHPRKKGTAHTSGGYYSTDWVTADVAVQYVKDYLLPRVTF